MSKLITDDVLLIKQILSIDTYSLLNKKHLQSSEENIHIGVRANEKSELKTEIIILLFNNIIVYY